MGVAFRIGGGLAGSRGDCWRRFPSRPRLIDSRSSSIGPRSELVDIPESFDRVVVEVGEAPSSGGVGPGSAPLARHVRHGSGRRQVRHRPHVLPGHLQLLPRLERWEAGRHHARHASAEPSRAGVSQPGGTHRLATQGSGRGAMGRPDRDGLRGVPSRDPGLVRMVRSEDSRDHRRSRPHLPASGR